MQTAIPELLAPAGSFETLDAGLEHGADAVYLGLGVHNLRSRAPNFTAADLPYILAKAAAHGARVYVTLNTMPFDADMPAIEDLLCSIGEGGSLPHAFIVADPGIVRICKRILPQVELHLSTQSGVFNAESLAFWKDEGIARVVLPREMSLVQIEELALRHIVPLEIFVHGAMCMAVSGRCLMGAYLYGRHPNQGDCPQPCRFKYAVAPIGLGSGMRGETIEIEEDESGSYLMNSKDLNVLPILDRVVRSGAVSLKIEGRNRSANYVATVVRVYRQALDALRDGTSPWTARSEWLDELESLDHRAYTTGFFAGELGLQDRAENRRDATMRVVGVVKARDIDGSVLVDVKNPFLEGDELSLLPISVKKPGRLVAVKGLRNFAGDAVVRALTNKLVRICDDGFSEGDILRMRV